MGTGKSPINGGFNGNTPLYTWRIFLFHVWLQIATSNWDAPSMGYSFWDAHVVTFPKDWTFSQKVKPTNRSLTLSPCNSYSTLQFQKIGHSQSGLYDLQGVHPIFLEFTLFRALDHELFLTVFHERTSCTRTRTKSR